MIWFRTNQEQKLSRKMGSVANRSDDNKFSFSYIDSLHQMRAICRKSFPKFHIITTSNSISRCWIPEYIIHCLLAVKNYLYLSVHKNNIKYAGCLNKDLMAINHKCHNLGKIFITGDAGQMRTSSATNTNFISKWWHFLCHHEWMINLDW